jgi:hypothetical protein
MPSARPLRLRALLLLLLVPAPAGAVVPEFTVDERGVHLAGVGPDSPIVYDNDWWTDVFDAYYVWVQASLGRADLRGNIVSRDMWDHPKYLYPMDRCVADARKALDLARAGGLRNVPELTIGSDRVLEAPSSGRIEDTTPHPSDGSRLIVREAKRASPERPLVVVVGGPLTTVANALLTDPEIAPNLVVFCLSTSSFGYNGKDGWSAYIVSRRTRLVEWATRSFWDRDSVLRAEHFEDLPKNPLTDEMRRFIRTDLGRANQLGDGAPLVWLFDPACWRGARLRKAEWTGRAVEFVEVADRAEADLIDIPKSQTDLDRSRAEFLRAVSDPRAYATP